MLQDPGGRAPAPGGLRVIQRFVNTVDLEHGHEWLERPAQLRDLLVELGVLDARARVTGADLRTAIEVREALRRLLLVNNGGAPDPVAAAAIARAALGARLTLTVRDDGGTALEAAAPGVAGALGRIAAVIPIAQAAGTWERLKACRQDLCHWAFYDRSRNRSSTWCSMSVCGNRTKTRAYRRRAAI